MTINTAADSGPRNGRAWAGRWLTLLALLSATGIARATPVLGPWETLFQGIDLARGTNTPGGGMPNQHVVQVVRVDLQDPDVRLLSSPRIDDYVNGSRESGGYTVSDFLAKHRLQVAVNAGLFTPSQYYLPPGTAMDISGLSV